VMAAIVAGGIDAKRLSAAGFGQERPVADNRSDEGRAKNRRVELVKK
jgi:OmpA-OmpF porin, OOP family